MSKKIIFIISVFLIIAVGIAGFFWWQNREIKGSPEDYVIKETQEGTIVENKKAGLTVKAPDEWEVEKMAVSKGSVIISTTDIEGEKINGSVVPPLTKGCGIEVSVVYKTMNFEEIEQEVRAMHWGLKIKSEVFEEVIINHHNALRNIFESDVLGPVMVVYIPKKNKLYDFDLYWAPEEKEDCMQEFNKFLETVSIR